MTTVNNYFHGAKTVLLQTDTAALNMPSTSIIGLIATSSDADATTFPLDTPVLVTDVKGALAKAGTAGTLATALAAIADCCSPVVIVVRVGMAAEGESQDTLTIGDYTGGTYTGMKALLMAEAVTGYRPKILGTPGLTSQATAEALIVIAKQLRAMHYSLAIGTDVTSAVTYAGNFGDREIELLWPETTVGNGDCEARAMGLRAAIDQSVGWHKSLSNVVIPNMDGLALDVSFTLDGTSSDATTLNDANITTIIAKNGFRFWGNRTCSTIAQYSFEVATRTSQALADMIDQAMFSDNDQPLTSTLVKTILGDINAAIRKYATPGSNQRLIGGGAWYDPTENADADLADGQLVIDYDFTPVAPLEGITNNQRITDKYYSDFSTQLQSVTQTVTTSS